MKAATRKRIAAAAAATPAASPSITSMMLKAFVIASSQTKERAMATGDGRNDSLM